MKYWDMALIDWISDEIVKNIASKTEKMLIICISPFPTVFKTLSAGVI